MARGTALLGHDARKCLSIDVEAESALIYEGKLGVHLKKINVRINVFLCWKRIYKKF